MRVAFFGCKGKVGTDICPALRAAGYDVMGVDVGTSFDLHNTDAIIDFTEASAVVKNVADALSHGIPCIVGTTGMSNEQLARLDELGKEAGKPVFLVPNFAIGAVLMMRFAREAAHYMERAEIVEMHHETKKDAPSGTAKATADLMGIGPTIHSVRLPGLVAHQEVLFGGLGQLLTIRHDTFSRKAYLPGIVLALQKIDSLPPGLTVGLEALLR
ncbi:MAG TPA: dihydrodipicolinate reductase C-terminal domain-containing protein [Gaiellaceae bacterium]|jgi:4-hydroxy-tetrahydrodipicolinate reductase